MRHSSGLVMLAIAAWTRSAAADPPVPPPAAAAEQPGVPPNAAIDTTDDPARIASELERAPPPPSRLVYFQYGVAFTTEQVIDAGAMCHDLSKPCILGSGGGIIIRGGWRSNGPLYIGAAYEVSKQDPDKLYRMATLQQARGELRYYIATHRVTEPYLSGSLGMAAYGNQWSIDTFGPTASVGGGIEYQITQRTVIGLALGYRLAYFTKFSDSSGTSRDGGVGQLFGLDLVLEQRAEVVSAEKK